MDAGSDNGTDWEINALLNPVYDVQRLGIDLVASPRHADLLFVTGPVTRHLELALRRPTRRCRRPASWSRPAPRPAAGVSAGQLRPRRRRRPVLPVDVYIPGDPPRPQAIIYGLLLAMDRVEQRRFRAELIADSDA